MNKPGRIKPVGSFDSEEDAARILKSIPEDEKPISRLERLGPTALSSSELLALLLGCDAKQQLPLRILETYGSLLEMANASPRDLLRVDGITLHRAARVRAALELGKRALSHPNPDRVVVRNPQDVVNLLSPDMSGLPQEQLRVVQLNTKNGVVGVTTVYQGSVHTLRLRPAEVFRAAIQSNCAAIVVAHNHPSGEPTPSPEDIAVTRELVSAGKTLDIEVLDHVVIGSTTQWASLKERGLGFG